MKVVVGIFLVVDVGLKSWVRKFAHYFGVELIFRGKLDYSLFCLIKDDKINMLVTESGKLNGLLEDASFTFAKSHITIVFILYFFKSVSSSLSAHLSWLVLK